MNMVSFFPCCILIMCVILQDNNAHSKSLPENECVAFSELPDHLKGVKLGPLAGRWYVYTTNNLYLQKVFGCGECEVEPSGSIRCVTDSWRIDRSNPKSWSFIKTQSYKQHQIKIDPVNGRIDVRGDAFKGHLKLKDYDTKEGNWIVVQVCQFAILPPYPLNIGKVEFSEELVNVPYVMGWDVVLTRTVSPPADQYNYENKVKQDECEPKDWSLFSEKGDKEVDVEVEIESLFPPTLPEEKPSVPDVDNSVVPDVDNSVVPDIDNSVVPDVEKPSEPEAENPLNPDAEKPSIPPLEILPIPDVEQELKPEE